MTGQQIIAIAITVLAVLAGSIFNNVRISDLNGGLNRRMDDLRDVLRAEMRAEYAQLRQESAQHYTEFMARFNSIDRKLDELLRLSADHDTRIARLEQRPASS